MKVFVDQSKCKAHGRCYEIAVDVFECGEAGKSKVINEHIDNIDFKVQASSAEMMCPEGAITVEED